MARLCIRMEQAHKRREEAEKEEETIRAGKRMMETKPRKPYIAVGKAERDEEKKAKEKILQKVNADKRILMSSPRAASKAEQMRECLRSLRRNHKDEDPRIMKEAFETLLIIVRNATNANEEKYRRIRIKNRLFEERVGRFKQGMDFLELCGFQKVEGSEFLSLSTHSADILRLRDAAFQLQSAITNPFFGLLSKDVED